MVYVPLLVPLEAMSVCDVVASGRLVEPVMLVVGSAPLAATMTPVEKVRLATGIVRAVVSTVPAALVGTVAVAVTVHAAPVPRESVNVQGSVVPVLDWVVPFSVTAERVTPAVVTLRAPSEMVDVTVSADAAGAAKADAAMTTVAMPAILVNLMMDPSGWCKPPGWWSQTQRRPTPLGAGWRVRTIGVVRQPVDARGMLVLIAFVLLFAGPAGAAETPRLGIKPAREANFFHLALQPGGRTTNRAVVSNFSDEVSRVRVYAVDGGTTPQGQFGLGRTEDPQLTVGKWLVPSVAELTLAPRSSAAVDFALDVPAGTTPGDYAGGLVVEGEPLPGPTQALGSATAVQLTIVERLGVRLYLKVDGTATTKLVAGPLTSRRVAASDAVEFSLALRNDGNTALAPVGVVTLEGLGLSGRSIALSRPELLLPGETTTVRGRWDHPPVVGFGHADARVTYANGRTAESSVDVRIVPLPLVGVLAFVALLLTFVAFRLVRFVRRARVALRMTAEAQAVSAR